ncbi:hypothetical protein E2C01_092499 [Portunus trituberculatus]|uniref:Uncharacterized protein n=1 Tax=Portunus trituberculatus TaxID=210409 RepID=A0A5B7JVY6_PORTR|nr:hypothetical protein [Portunus trituberculatus]
MSLFVFPNPSLHLHLSSDQPFLPSLRLHRSAHCHANYRSFGLASLEKAAGHLFLPCYEVQPAVRQS